MSAIRVGCLLTDTPLLRNQRQRWRAEKNLFLDLEIELHQVVATCQFLQARN